MSRRRKGEEAWVEYVKLRNYYIHDSSSDDFMDIYVRNRITDCNSSSPLGGCQVSTSSKCGSLQTFQRSSRPASDRRLLQSTGPYSGDLTILGPWARICELWQVSLRLPVSTVEDSSSEDWNSSGLSSATLNGLIQFTESILLSSGSTFGQ